MKYIFCLNAFHFIIVWEYAYLPICRCSPYCSVCCYNLKPHMKHLFLYLSDYFIVLLKFRRLLILMHLYTYGDTYFRKISIPVIKLPITPLASFCYSNSKKNTFYFKHMYVYLKKLNTLNYEFHHKNIFKLLQLEEIHTTHICVFSWFFTFLYHPYTCKRHFALTCQIT